MIRGQRSREGGASTPVTVASFDNSFDAHLAQIHLEAHGIECFVTDENIVAMDWLLSNAIGGIKLTVRGSDARVASGILERHARAAEQASGKEARRWERSRNPRNSAPPRIDRATASCPRCGSANVYREKLPANAVWWIYLLSLGGLMLPLFRRQHRCARCGQVWEQRGEPGAVVVAVIILIVVLMMVLRGEAF